MPVTHIFKALPSRSHIRVMILEPSGDPASTLRFLFHEDLLSNLEGRYEAISYTWGTPDLEFPIHLVDEQETAVLWLWADTVCINQNDHSEKEGQIRMMVDIFRGAKRVLAWLGPGGHSEDEAFQFLERVSRDPKRGLDGFSPFSELAKTLRKLLALPYFTRLWILQELVFNLDVILRCGSIEFPFLRFCVAIEVLKDNLGGGGLSMIGLPPHALRVRLRSLKKISQLWKRHTMIIREGVDPQYLQDTILGLLVQFSDCTSLL
ncbi:heterokaryon incompatibility protein-domain-containing protein [Lophiotrema nucula]|uniref:Heterokaryon incompatibility protein-domain-containing protein n=1 Tax=Lophiotrema nucula TaxID=690887 RepID=A0A6A5YJ13_9PLEO|nr:heterokaryon incompatibility protein-domain-containing protein [Lophiotrema nucula]